MGIYKMRTEFGHHMKILLIVIAAIFVVAAFFTFSPPSANKSNSQSESSEGPDVIATANGKDILRSDFDAMFEKKYGDQSQQQPECIKSALTFANERTGLFGLLMQNAIVVSVAKQNGVQISRSEVDAEIDRTVDYYLRQDREKVLPEDEQETSCLRPEERQQVHQGAAIKKSDC